MIEVKQVAYRFNADMLKLYAERITRAQDEGRQVFIVTSPENQEKFKDHLPHFIGDTSFAAIRFVDYPASEREANNLGRGTANVTWIVVDDTGHYTDIMAPVMQAVGNPDVLFVQH